MTSLNLPICTCLMISISAWLASPYSLQILFFRWVSLLLKIAINVYDMCRAYAHFEHNMLDEDWGACASQKYSSCNPRMSNLRPSENRHEGKIAKSREMVAVEAHQGKSWNAIIFSHRDARNILYSPQSCDLSSPNLWNWNDHKFVKHNTTPRYVYQSVFKNFAKFFLLFPHS